MRTTLDPRLQTRGQAALMEGLETYDRRHGWRGAFGHVTTLEGWQDVAKQNAKPAERPTGARPSSPASAAVVRVPHHRGQTGALAREDVAWARATKGIGAGDLIFVAADDRGRVPAEADPGGERRPGGHGAALRAACWRMVGGYSFSLSSFNRATQAMRQPGSAFKPIVYATALENGYTPASVVMDAPITLTGANGQAWTPENYEHDYFGPLQLRKGLELSRNAMTVRLAQGVGMTKISASAERLGVVNNMDKVLAMALGAGETTVFKLAGAYASFVNGGKKIEPHLIELVQDREGKTILQADKRDCARCGAGFNGDESPRIPAAGAQVWDPITAYQITSMLQGVVQRGTARRPRSSAGRPAARPAPPTSTAPPGSWASRRSWCRHLHRLRRQPQPRQRRDRRQAAVPIFIDFMTEAIKGYPPDDFKAPSNAKFAMVRGIREAFRPAPSPGRDRRPACPSAVRSPTTRSSRTADRRPNAGAGRGAAAAQEARPTTSPACTKSRRGLSGPSVTSGVSHEIGCRGR
jgi:penicillin-binding protein 1A